MTTLLAVIAGVAAYSISAYEVRQDARHDMQLHIAEGVQAYSDNNCSVAYKKLAPLRDNLNPQAIYILATMYLSECGVPAASERADDAVAIPLLTQAANAGYVRAEVALADLYAGGVAGKDFDERDTKSLFWFQRAAFTSKAGTPEAPSPRRRWIKQAVPGIGCSMTPQAPMMTSNEETSQPAAASA